MKLEDVTRLTQDTIACPFVLCITHITSDDDDDASGPLIGLLIPSRAP